MDPGRWGQWGYLMAEFWLILVLAAFVLVAIMVVGCPTGGAE